jgi:hypothetical protein
LPALLIFHSPSKYSSSAVEALARRIVSINITLSESNGHSITHAALPALETERELVWSFLGKARN